MDNEDLFDRLVKVMREEGPVWALRWLEDEIGMEAPKGLCLCQSKIGGVTIIGEKVENQDKLDKFYDAMDISETNANEISYAGAKTKCSMNYARKE